MFCFSDGVSLEDEVALKRRAAERGLLFMGADCGTAIIDGVALGFANAVARGPVGIVGASGTGIQEVSCLLDAAGVGVSHAIGVGGRDLSAEVGGLMTRAGLELLAGDEDTRVIVAISKPPDPAGGRRDRGGRGGDRQAGDPRAARRVPRARERSDRARPLADAPRRELAGGDAARARRRAAPPAGARARCAASTAAARCATEAAAIVGERRVHRLRRRRVHAGPRAPDDRPVAADSSASPPRRATRR